MKLHSNRKNVSKIVAAASSSVLFSCAPTYQLNGVGNDFPAVENLRDALKSNMGLETFKNWIVTSLNNRVLIPVKNTAVDVAKWKVFRFPLGLLRSAACKVLSSCFRNSQERSTTKQLPHHVDNFKKSEHVKSLPHVELTETTEPLPAFSKQPSQPRVDNSQKSKIAGSILAGAWPYVYEEKPLEDVVHSGEKEQVQLAGNLQKENTESIQAHDDSSLENEVANLMQIEIPMQNTEPLPLQSDQAIQHLAVKRAEHKIVKLELRKNKILKYNKKPLFVRVGHSKKPKIAESEPIQQAASPLFSCDGPPVFPVDSLKYSEIMFPYLRCLLNNRKDRRNMREDIPKFKGMLPEKRNVYIKQFLKKAQLKRLNDDQLRDVTVLAMEKCDASVLKAFLTAIPRPIAFTFTNGAVEYFLRDAARLQPPNKRQLLELCNKMKAEKCDSALLNLLEVIRQREEYGKGVPADSYDKLKLVLDMTSAEDAKPANVIRTLAREHFLVNVLPEPLKLRMLKAITDVYGE